MLPHQRNLLRVSVQLIRCLQVKWQILQCRVLHDADEGFFSNAAFPNLGMAVFVGSEWI